MDRGDIQDPYSTITATNGPAHTLIISNSIGLGASIDPKTDGQPDATATGDDVDGNDDEDGVNRISGQEWTNDTNVGIDLTLNGSIPTGDVEIWIDWNGNGTFEASEFYTFSDLPANAATTVTVTVPSAGTYTVGNPLAIRVRLFDDTNNAPGGNLDASDFGGPAVNGEVEDYIWNFTPTAIFLEDISARTTAGFIPLVGVGLLLLLAVTAIVLLRRLQLKEANVVERFEE